MSGFSKRSDLTERIDDPSLPAADYAAAMADLEKANRALFATYPTFAFLRVATRGMRAFRLLDAGSGHGDYLRAIARWARARGIAATLTGVDLSPAATAAARAATPADLGITYITGDIFDHEPDPPPDFIVSSLFTHHLPDAAVERFIAWMETHAARGWHINDLHRHPLAWAGFRALSAVMRWHPIVRHDGAISVLRGFTAAELRARIAGAGVAPDAAKVRWHPLFRFGVDRMK